jgi:hypothetical protein
MAGPYDVHTNSIPTPFVKHIISFGQWRWYGVGMGVVWIQAQVIFCGGLLCFLQESWAAGISLPGVAKSILFNFPY